MPLFEISQDQLVPFRRLIGGFELYEHQIESLIWSDLEELTGETLFPITRQAKLPDGGIPDIVALDKSGRVVVFEIKRDVDRKQLAQCMEYAGWARLTNLDELAGMYHRGSDQFWPEWQEFTETGTPVVVNPHPRLVLIARDFQERTQSAFDFLVESGVPVRLIRVTVYEDLDGRRLVDVESDHEPELTPPTAQAAGAPATKIFGRTVKIEDLLEHEYLKPGDELTWNRSKKQQLFTCLVTESGGLALPSGDVYWSPSGAAAAVAGLAAYDGWYAWTTAEEKKLHELRSELVEMLSSTAVQNP